MAGSAGSKKKQLGKGRSRHEARAPLEAQSTLFPVEGKHVEKFSRVGSRVTLTDEENAAIAEQHRTEGKS